MTSTIGKVSTTPEKNTVVVKYVMGTGVTTFCRHVMYDLRKKFLCIILKTDGMLNGSKKREHQEFLKELHDASGLPLLIHLDSNNMGNIDIQNIKNDLFGNLQQSQDYITFLETQKIRGTGEDKGDATTIVFPKGFGSEELRRLGELRKESHIGTHVYGSPDDVNIEYYMTEMGFLDLERLEKNKTDFQKLKKMDTEHLLNAGIPIQDIVYLKGNSNPNPSPSPNLLSPLPAP